MSQNAVIARALDHQRNGRLSEAGACCRAVLEVEPDNAEAWHLLGLLTHQAGDDVNAVTLIRQAIAGSPKVAVFHANLGVVLLRARRPSEAAEALRTAIRLRPTEFGAHANLGVALFASGDYAGAVKAAGAALCVRPGDPATLCNRALALQSTGQHGAALIDIEAALVADPASYTAHLMRGTLLLAIGRVHEAISALDAAIALRPDDARARQARIVCANYLPGASTETISKLARAWAPQASPDPAPFPDIDRSPSRPLRIGYVSADFRNHPVGYFLHDVLKAHDPAKAIVFCYDNAPESDAMTDRLRRIVEHWRPIANLDDPGVQAMIRSDRIDILVDLAGHTQGNRLGVFARRAAPVQAAWLGYFGTTGGAAIDFIIADNTVLPAQDERFFTEQVVRLPDSYFCFTPPTEAGPVTPPLARQHGQVTFGCFNNRAKLSPATLDVWARLLARVPKSKLFLKSAQYADKEVRRTIVKAFDARAIGPERLLFEGASPMPAMFDAYGRVDVALDPFPFGGGATTAQALWMGVPVVSLLGETWVGRQGASLLSAAGFREWVAKDEESYIAIAEQLAADHPRRYALRSSQRDIIATSPLCQADRFAPQLQSAYRRMWKTYLRM